MDSQYQIVRRHPSLEEYRVLCESAGWTSRDWAMMPTALVNSQCVVIARHGGAVVGMARLIGDGVKFFYVEDVVVLPEHQGRGVGHGLMEAIMQYVDEQVPDLATVSLMADSGKTEFYEQFGFQPRPADAPGMEFHVRRSPGA